MTEPVCVNPSAWYLLRSGPGHYAFNMALDEALLESMPRLGRPVLRLYGWTQPAASFGYFQKYAQVAQLTPLRPLVRRPTGGGLVPHDADWTYSLAFPPDHEWYALSAIESYRRVHEWIQAAFNRLNVSTELALAPHATGPGQCFAGHEQFDLLRGGTKIAGAAQRRRRDGLLLQGSIQTRGLPASVPRADWERAMSGSGETREGAEWVEFVPDAQFSGRTHALAADKYSQPAYNQRR
jgi:lipoate-protein ligase A